MSPAEFSISRHYEGYPGIVQGGYAAGLMAKGLGSTAEVTLRAPPRVDVPIAGRSEAGTRMFSQAGNGIAEARAATLHIEPPPPPVFREAMQVRGRCAAHLDIPWANCYACGTARGPGEGLCIWPGELGEQQVAAPWVPDAGLTDADGLVGTEYFWSALDCPGWYALIGGEMRALVTGRMTVCLASRPVPGTELVVTAWPMRLARGRLLAGSAVWNGKNLVAVARSMWFERPAGMPG